MTDSIRRAYADTANGQLHYLEAGSGDNLILLGETPRISRFFERFIPLLAPYFHVVAPDLPGLGNSHALPVPTSVPDIADCMVEFLDALGVEHTHIFGMHTGNKVAAALAANHSEYVDRLILAGQPHSIIASHAGRNAALTPIRDRYRASQNASEDLQSRQIREWLNTKLTLDAAWWPEKVLAGGPVNAGMFAAAEAKVIDVLLGWRSVVPIYEAVFAFDLEEAVSRISAPALVLELMPPEEQDIGSQAEVLAELMKHGRATTIPVTHGAAMENQRDQIAAILIAFLQATETH